MTCDLCFVPADQTLIHVNNVNMARALEVPKQTTSSAVPRSSSDGEKPSDVATMATSTVGTSKICSVRAAQQAN